MDACIFKDLCLNVCVDAYILDKPSCLAISTSSIVAFINDDASFFLVEFVMKT